MKIVDRLTLMGMPAGTLYAEHHDGEIGDPLIKGETVPGGMRDWIVLPLVVLREYRIDAEFSVRDGGYDPDAKYVVLDATEHMAVIGKLIAAFTSAYNVPKQEQPA